MLPYAPLEMARTLSIVLLLERRRAQEQRHISRVDVPPRDRQTVEHALVQIVGLLDVVIDTALDAEVTREGVDVQVRRERAEDGERFGVLHDGLIGLAEDAGTDDLLVARFVLQGVEGHDDEVGGVVGHGRPVCAELGFTVNFRRLKDR